MHFIGIACGSGAGDSPLQRVRLDTAHGHVLLSDPATRDDGRAVLECAAAMAARYGLGHLHRGWVAVWCGVTVDVLPTTGQALRRPGRAELSRTSGDG